MSGFVCDAVTRHIPRAEETKCKKTHISFCMQTIQYFATSQRTIIPFIFHKGRLPKLNRSAVVKRDDTFTEGNIYVYLNARLTNRDHSLVVECGHHDDEITNARAISFKLRNRIDSESIVWRWWLKKKRERHRRCSSSQCRWKFRRNIRFRSVGRSGTIRAV